MGADEYHPLSHHGSNLTEAGGIGYTVADSIDTMLIMGLDDEYQRARSWVEDKLDFGKDGNFNTFEAGTSDPSGRLVISNTNCCYFSSTRPRYVSLVDFSLHTT
jgi:hypothetical protein